jgi:hypothetical protein
VIRKTADLSDSRVNHSAASNRKRNFIEGRNHKKVQRTTMYMEQHTRNRGKRESQRVKDEARGLGLIGKRFGELVVLRRSRSGRVGAWVAKCDCGKLTMVYDYLLKSGHTKNCGCELSNNELKV